MNRWLKILIGIVLIAAAAFGMYYWNSKGREKLMQIEEEANMDVVDLPIPDLNEKIYAAGDSFFPIPYSWISVRSSKISSGDYVGVYCREYESCTDDEYEYTASILEKLGSFEISSVSEHDVEIICSVDEYMKIENSLKKFNSNLVIVMEAKYE